MSVIHIDRNNFQSEVLDSDRPVLLDFWPLVHPLPDGRAQSWTRSPGSGATSRSPRST